MLKYFQNNCVNIVLKQVNLTENLVMCGSKIGNSYYNHVNMLMIPMFIIHLFIMYEICVSTNLYVSDNDTYDNYHDKKFKFFYSNRKVDLNKKNVGGWSPLMYACYIGHDNIVNLLLDAGVSVNVKNHKGQTPLMLASSCGNESVGYFLVQVL